jgi:predicted metal-binding protein
VVGTLIEGNKILHEAKMNADVTIKFQPIPVEDIRIIAFSDASFASAKVPDSHQGMLVMAGHKNISTNQNSPVNPLVWHSKKIQKVVVSTLSAEAMSLAGAVDTLAWIRLYWAWIRDGKCQWQKADETLMQLPPAFAAIPPEDDSKSSQPPEAVQDALSKLPQTIKSIITTDCKSLFDLISRQAPPSCQEFRTLLQAKLIKEHLNNGVSIRWVPSQAQLADALTKIMDSSVLRECLKRGRYSLHDEDEILRARSDSRARLQWLRNMSDGSKGNDSEGGKAKTSTL